MDRRGCVLVVGDDLLATAIEFLGVRVRTVHTAAETEGIGVDVVVVSGRYPMEELTEVRVHPRLYDRPVVLVAAGRTLPPRVWHAIDVWPVTRHDPDAIQEITQIVGTLLARAHHPSTAGDGRVAVLS